MSDHTISRDTPHIKSIAKAAKIPMSTKYIVKFPADSALSAIESRLLVISVSYEIGLTHPPVGVRNFLSLISFIVSFSPPIRVV